MTDPKRELELAQKYLHELDTRYLQEVQQGQAERDLGRQRGRKNKGNWEEILASSGVNLEKIREFERAATQRAVETYKDEIKRLTPVPPGILSKAQESIKINQLGVMAPDPTPSNWLIWQVGPLSPVNMGDCGSVNAGYIHPKAEAWGEGLGWDWWDDEKSQDTQCGWAYVLPSQFFPGPANRLWQIVVSPFLDMRGFIRVSAATSRWTDKHAYAKLTISTIVSQAGADDSNSWPVRDLYLENDDQSGRLDKTAYVLQTSVQKLVRSGEPVQIEVRVEAYCDARGDGSNALLDFQSDQNHIYMPWVQVSAQIP